jgi:hypothetical protein
MKLTEDQKKLIKERWGDWEIVHGNVDDLMRERLKELDPEWLEDLDQVTYGATFWYA